MAIQVNRLTFVSMKGIIITGFLIILGSILTSCQEIDYVCSSKITCSDCITSDPQCVWCKAKDDRASGERCRTLNTLNNKCAISDIVNPQRDFTRNRERSLSPPNTTAENIVQLWPQEVILKTRIKSPFKFQVKFRQAEDYPVDLYFLMDMSYSMLDDKKNLAALGNLLGETMGNITRNFRLGFGSFVDKPVGPFVNTHPDKLIAPCPNCAAPYSFINHMPLAKDVDNFVTKVRESRISGNLDTPEGAFDAMMQAIVCNKEIGWRIASRKILLVATDAGFHLAGDGKLGGIVRPNDELCHLDRNGIYTESTTLDYPSIGQINEQVIRNNINVIFAATAGAFSIYRDLRGEIVGTHTGQLTTNSDNIVDIIKEQYAKISSTVELKDNAPNNVQLTYYSKCLDSSKPKSKTNKCHGLRVGTEVDFDVDIEVVSCPPNAINRKLRFEISPVGLAETVVVNLELMCECDCQQHKERNSRYCSGVGTYECGACICPDGSVGQHCECDAKAMDKIQDETPCTPRDSSVRCSGRGTCICQQCNCYSSPEKRIYGHYCECDDVSCPLYKGQLCGGEERGQCHCGRCQCLPGWSGDTCECSTSIKTCESPDGVVCSGNGICVCGECRCNAGFFGLVCEMHQDGGARCEAYKVCAHCFAFKDQMPGWECSVCAGDTSFVLVDKAQVAERSEVECVVRDDNGCNFYFVYDSSDQSSALPIRVQRTKECPTKLI